MGAPRVIITSPTQRRDFQECPTKWGFKHVARIASPKTGPLVLGGAFHAGLEDYYLSSSPARAIISTRRYVEESDLPVSEDHDPKPLLSIKATALVVGYIQHYGKTDSERWQALDCESEYRVIMARGLHDTGRMDMIIRDKKTNLVWLVETKTRSQLSEDWLTQLPIDAQINRYLDVLRQRGLDPAGVIYNIIRTPQIRPGKNETLDEYRERLRKDIEERPTHYFARTDVFSSNMDVYRTKIDAIETSRAIREAFKPEVPLLRHTGSCIRGYQTCEFLPLCSVGMDPKRIDKTPPGFRAIVPRSPAPITHSEESKV